jgi:hypothetical protein
MGLFARPADAIDNRLNLAALFHGRPTKGANGSAVVIFAVRAAGPRAPVLVSA